MQGKTAVITGSTSGIGKGIAEALAGAGANIMLNGLGDAAAIEEQRASFEAQFGIKAGYHGADMTRPEEIADLIATAEAEFGAVDILVNNAGIQHTDSIEDFPIDRWDAVIAINLSSSFLTMRAAVPGMKARGYGRIVNISSIHGLVASVQKSAYVAAKHGLIGLTKVVALENAGNGVTCNAICPGWVLTALVEKQIQARVDRDGIPFDQASRDLLAEKQPSGAFTTIEQLGQAALYLCGDAAANITGTTLSLDGGWGAQ
jgi:3-hydroxybutyrate dehydrogenase